MLFRDLVALRFIKSLSAWNRKSLLVEGGSQGGFQALAMAALDPEVTGCRAIVPWMGDIGGEKLGRKKIGWRPESSPGLACYDIIHFGKMIKCPVELQITLGDPVCPVAGRWLLWMALRGADKTDGGSECRSYRKLLGGKNKIHTGKMTCSAVSETEEEL